METKNVEQSFAIDAAVLKAAVIATGKDDVRYYLNGVYFKPAESGLFVVATDGHRLFATKIEDIKLEEKEPFIVPRKLISDIKAGAEKVWVERNNNGISLRVTYARRPTATIAGQLIDGRFPDWISQIPKNPSGETGQFNAEYLADAQKALAVLTGRKTCCIHVQHNGEKAALITTPNADNALVLCMPMRPAGYHSCDWAFSS